MPIPEKVTISGEQAPLKIQMIKNPSRSFLGWKLLQGSLRCAGCVGLLFGAGLIWFGICFLIAELLGVVIVARLDL